MASQRGAMLTMLLAAAVLAVVTGTASGQLTCSQVFNGVMPCLNYLRSGGQITSECCSGIHGLVAAAQTTADRQIACNCLKAAANAAGPIDYGRAAGLPRACNANIPYQISPNTDCSRVR